MILTHTQGHGASFRRTGAQLWGRNSVQPVVVQIDDVAFWLRLCRRPLLVGPIKNRAEDAPDNRGGLFILIHWIVLSQVTLRRTEPNLDQTGGED